MKITELREGGEYAARLFPQSPHIVSHIRLLSTSKTADYKYKAGWGYDEVKTKALPAVSIDDDGTEHPRAVLPKHIFATWEEYGPTYEAQRAEKQRREMFRAQANEQIVVEDLGNKVVVLLAPSPPPWVSDRTPIAEFLMTGVVADKATMMKAANKYADTLRHRFVQLAMGELQREEVPA